MKRNPEYIVETLLPLNTGFTTLPYVFQLKISITFMCHTQMLVPPSSYKILVAPSYTVTQNPPYHNILVNRAVNFSAQVKYHFY